MNRGTLKEVLAAAKKYSQHLTKEHVAVLRKNGAPDESYVQHEYTSDKDMKHMIADLRNKRYAQVLLRVISRSRVRRILHLPDRRRKGDESIRC